MQEAASRDSDALQGARVDGRCNKQACGTCGDPRLTPPTQQTFASMSQAALFCTFCTQIKRRKAPVQQNGVGEGAGKEQDFKETEAKNLRIQLTLNSMVSGMAQAKNINVNEAKTRKTCTKQNVTKQRLTLNSMVSGMAQGGTTAWPGTTTALEKMVVPAAGSTG